MTTYNPPTDAELTAEKGITQDKMRRLRDIGPAITEGAVGAPKIQLAALDTDSVNASKIVANAVGNSELDSSAVKRGNMVLALAEQNVSVPTTNYANLVPTGGAYSLNVFAGRGVQTYISQVPNNGTYSNTVRFYNSYESGSVTAYITSRYIAASPPYDLGDGEVGHFIFAQIERATGKVVGLSSGEDAPWHNNGPTDCSADFYDKQGRGWRYRKSVPDSVGNMGAMMGQLRSKSLKGEALTQSEVDLMRDYANAFAASEVKAELITQKIKQADMHLIPHPWPDYDLDKLDVVLLDPVIDLTHTLSQAVKEHDDLKMFELFEAGALVVTNTEVPRAGPPGVKVVDYGWKSGTGIVK